MKVLVENIATEYLVQGPGPVLLLLHGRGDSLHSFDLLADRLKNHYTIVRLDLPGFGSSELPKGDWGVYEYANFVRSFCEKIEIAPEYIVGHSFGGRILIKGLGHNIFTPKKIVLTASAGVADRPTMHNSVFTFGSKIAKFLMSPFPISWYLRLRKEFYTVTGGDYVSAGALSRTFVRVINEDLSADAKAIKTPALLIWGRDDVVTPLSEGKKMNHFIASSTLKVLDNAGHFVHKEKADQVAELVREFCI